MAWNSQNGFGDYGEGEDYLMLDFVVVNKDFDGWTMTSMAVGDEQERFVGYY
jgi:hypothetical protein